MRPKRAILEAKRAILEAKMAEVIYDEAILGRSVEWRRPFGYAKSTTSTAGAQKNLIRLAILSGCGGYKRSAHSAVPPWMLRGLEGLRSNQI